MRRPLNRALAPLFTSILCIALIGCGGGLDPEQTGAGPSAQIDALFESVVAENSPGAAVMVIRDGEILHAQGYGLANIEEGTPITPQSAFRLASVSKQFTAMAIMILAERGQLDYDDKLVEYLPELDRFGPEITLRHLLTHLSGLPDYYDVLEEETHEGMPTTEDVMRFLSGWGEPLFAPGEKWEYSNPAYEMLAVVVERVSGQRFGRFLEENIFVPLEMHNSVVRDSTEPEIPTRVLGYSKEEGSFVLNDDHILNHIIGSGGLYSTLEDLYLWDQALFTEDLVTAPTLEEAWSPVRLNDGEDYPYGFGWGLEPYGALGRRLAHSGGWVGFSTFIVRYPERQFTVIVLSNFSEFESGVFADRITDIYFPSTLIAGATVVDGTGTAQFSADVRVKGDRIVAVGDLEPRPDEPVLNAENLVLAPGFIDTHSHADDAILDHPGALAALSQGVTTVVVGPDGGSRYPLDEFFTTLGKNPSSVNIASFVGHGTLREKVMGDDFKRTASVEEIEQMKELLAQEMDAGALGLSTGLEYDPGIYSSTEEVIELARVAAAHDGRYTSHIRSEDRRFWEAIDEILTIGQEAGIPVLVTHIKLAMRSSHGKAAKLLALLDEARADGVEVTADIYPYTYWQSTLTVMFPDRDFEDREAALFAVEELSSPEDMLIPVFEADPSLAGMTLAEIAALRGTDAAETLMALIRETDDFRKKRGPDADTDHLESVIAVSMEEADIERLLNWPHMSICTDGELDGTHPRGFGSFPRVLARYVRERQVLSLEAAIHKMTGQAVSNVGLQGRGRIEVGAFADFVLFDPATIQDHATAKEPQALSTGIQEVWVNGHLAYRDGWALQPRHGRVLRREPAP